MPKSKVDKSRKDKLNNYKNKNKKEFVMQQNVNLPQEREVPTWSADERMEVTGKEFELIYNFLTSIGDAYAAANSIMSRNILNGKVRINFERLGPNGYEPIPEEEQAPKREEYQKLVNSILAQQNSVQDSMPEELIPVDDNGVRILNP